MRLSYFLLAPVLALGASAQILPRSFNIEGCVSPTIVANLLLDTSTGIAAGAQTTEESCATACRGLDRNYGYFFPTAVSLGGLGPLGVDSANCICSNTSPTLSQLIDANAAVNGALTGGICAATNGEAISVNSQFDLRACATADAITNTAVGTPATVTSVSQCVAQCNGISTAVYAVLNLSSGLCTCTTSTRVTNAAGLGVCARGGAENAIYLNGNAVVPSGGARKREFTQKALGLCPTGLQACLVNGDSAAGTNAFECLDTRAELESCGGCTNGYADITANAALVGTDCSSLPGVALGGSTCTLGKCEILACKAGHNLVNGRCVRA